MMEQNNTTYRRLFKFVLGLPWEIEYQVLEGGDLDIDFMVISPKGQILIDEKRSEEGLHEISTTDKGDYQVTRLSIQHCLFTSLSLRFVSTTCFLE